MLTSNPHWNQHIKHLSLEFSSTQDYYLRPDLLNCHRSPNSIYPSQHFERLCNHIAANLTNLETLYLWLELTPGDIEQFFQKRFQKRRMTQKNECLVELIRNIPVKPGGKFVVRLLVNPLVRDSMSNSEWWTAQGDPHFKPFMPDWEGPDGPVRYGKMCKEYEKKFEALMRPDSLCPVEESGVEMGETEQALEKMKVADQIAKETEALRKHFEKREHAVDNFMSAGW